jgi:hypothetical protein
LKRDIGDKMKAWKIDEERDTAKGKDREIRRQKEREGE